MELLKNILLISCSFLLIALAFFTGKKLKLIGIPGLFAIIVFYLVWVIGNLIELNSSDFYWMLLGRNIEQIGVFFTPLSTLYFSIGYTANRKLLKFAYIISVVQVRSVLLIFTDQYHHIMRELVMVETDALFGNAIAVKTTTIGTVLVAFNFCIPLIAITNLIMFMRTISAKLRRSLVLIIISIIATFVISAIHFTVLSNLGINIPIPVLNLPCLVLWSYAVLRGGFLGVTPTVLEKVFEVIDQGIIVVNENGRVIEFNKRASELINDMSYSDGIRINSDILEFIYGVKSSDKESFPIDDLPGELKSIENNRYISLTHHELKALRGKLVGYVIVLTDITLLKSRAEIDYLTGIYNREGMANAFSDLQKQLKNSAYVSALVIDLDNFKTINDTYGHFGGDMILKDLVSTMQGFLPGKFVFGRLGGDEFVVLLPMELEEAAALAENLRKIVSDRIVQYLNSIIQYTISVGIGGCINNQCELVDLLHKADLALYKAKNDGKNLISV